MAKKETMSSRSQAAVWMRLYVAAVAGLLAAPNGPSYGDVADRAVKAADAALAALKDRFPGTTNFGSFLE